MQLGSPRPLNYMRIRGFNGTSDFYSQAMNLLLETKLTFSFWEYQEAFANNDHLLLEFNTNGVGGNQFNPNSGGTGKWAMLMDGGGGQYDTFTRPSGGAWHHYAIIQDRTAKTNTAYVDTVLQSLTNLASGVVSPTWANSTFYFMSRGGTSLFNQGKLGSFGIWDSTVTLTAGQIANLAAYQLPSTVQKSGLLLEVTW